VIDSESAKATEAGGPRGYDAGSGAQASRTGKYPGRGLKLQAHPASIQDRDRAGPSPAASRNRFPFIKRFVR
jgi:hypothetical protein